MLNEFKQAQLERQQYIDSFNPLKEKFKEFKEVLDSKFIKKGIWWKKDSSAISCNMVDILKYEEHNYLIIEIGNRYFLMSIGECGDFKDKVYFIDSSLIPQGKVIYELPIVRYYTKYYNEKNTLSLVQMFSLLIKEYKEYLHG
jgi:hypothetical protein